MPSFVVSPSTGEALLSLVPPEHSSLPDLTHLPPPREPATLAEAGVTEGELDALVLKHLLQSGTSTGASLSRQIGLPRLLVAASLERLRGELLIAIRTSVGMSDYRYQLTDAGIKRARQYALRSNYIGPAPVPLASYRLAIRHQSLQKVRLSQLEKGLEGLELNPRLLSRLAQGMNDGRGIFLYGSPGNGKTSIAERLCDACGSALWIPRMVSVAGELIRLFDPSCHQEVEVPGLEAKRYDRRWVLIRRPTVAMGGELTLDHFDTRFLAAAGISEAPPHLKANGGCLVIDDFGRQRASSSDILNRLIVPLEKGVDYLNLASGRQIQIPFDMLFVLSTNLDPRALVDEAFLRRIPYKIEVPSPTPEQFTRLWERLVDDLGFATEPGVLEYLLATHFEPANRPLRFCHPRDLLRQVHNYCEVHEQPLVVTREAIDVAVENYFSTL